MFLADIESATFNQDYNDGDENSPSKKSSLQFSPWYLLAGLAYLPFMSGGGSSSTPSRTTPETGNVKNAASSGIAAEITTTPKAASFPVSATGTTSAADDSLILYSLPKESVVLQFTAGGTPVSGVKPSGNPIGATTLSLPAPTGGGVRLTPFGSGAPGAGGGIGTGSFSVVPEPSSGLAGLVACLTIAGGALSIRSKYRR